MDSPKPPTLKDSQKPQVKLRGLGAGATWFDRLKQFKKKDLAFILAGLGTLLMAPLAEHFMMAPEAGDSALNAGFGKGGSFFPGNGGSPYEPGSSGFAPGGAIGGGSDVITPLNVRDPSALVMGPGSTQQPPAGSVAPGTPPPTAPASRSDSELKDALAASARGVTNVTNVGRRLLPIPKIALAGGGLRGLNVTPVGGSGPSANLGPIAATGPSRPNVGGGIAGVRAAPGYRGVAHGQTQGGTGFDNLKKAADAAGSLMNQGAASKALNEAAAMGIPAGGSGYGGPGGGPAGPDHYNNGIWPPGIKNASEALEFLKQKKIQDAQIALWAKEQEANDMFLQMNQWRNKMIDAIVGKTGEALGVCTAKLAVGDACKEKDKGKLGYFCQEPKKMLFNMSDKNDGCAGGEKGSKGWMLVDPTTIVRCTPDHTQFFKCDSLDPPADDATPAPDPAVRHAGGVDAEIVFVTGKNLEILSSQCGKIKTAAANSTAEELNYLKGLYTEARVLVVVRDAISKDGRSQDCTDQELLANPVNEVNTGKESIQTKMRTVAELTIGKNASDQTSSIGKMKQAATGDPLAPVPDKLPGTEELNKAEEQLVEVGKVIRATRELLSGAVLAHNAPLPGSWNGEETKKNAKIFSQAIKSSYADAGSVLERVELAQNRFTGVHKQLDIVVKGGGIDSPAGNSGAAQSDKRPTLKAVLENKLDLKNQQDIAKNKAIAESAPSKPTSTPATGKQANIDSMRAAIEAADTAMNDEKLVQIGQDKQGAVVSIRKGLKPALVDYAKLEKGLAETPELQNKVRTQIGVSLVDSKAASSAAVQVQAAWLDEIRTYGP